MDDDRKESDILSKQCEALIDIYCDRGSEGSIAKKYWESETPAV